MADTTKQQGSTALVDAEKSEARIPEIITSQEEYHVSRLRWEEKKYNILTPFRDISGLAPAHGVLASLILINTDVDAKEVYSGLPFLKKDEVALAKRGLRKIADGLGISTELEHLSVGTVSHYWHVKAIATYRGLDGAVVLREASQEWDLRDGSDRLKGWTANQIQEGRKYGLRNCEARAINAAIRECGCGIKQAYYRDELARLFLAIRVMLNPDMSDPDQKRAVIENFYRGTATLYPQAPHALAAETPEPKLLEESAPAVPIEPERMATDAPPADSEEFTLDEPAEKAQPENLFHVTKVLRKGKDASAQFFIETREGITLFTSDAAVAKACAVAQKDEQPREVETERVLVAGKAYRQIVELSAPERLV